LHGSFVEVILVDADFTVGSPSLSSISWAAWLASFVDADFQVTMKPYTVEFFAFTDELEYWTVP